MNNHYHHFKKTLIFVGLLGLSSAQAAVHADDQAVITAMCQSITNLNTNGGTGWDKACSGTPIGNGSGEIIPLGMQLNNDHITSLDLFDKGVKGTITPQITALKKLEYLDLSRGNLAGGIPQIPSSLCGIHLEENLFTFKDILPNIAQHRSVMANCPDPVYRIEPQKKIDNSRVITLGTSISTQYKKHTNDRVQWYKVNGNSETAISGATGHTYTPASLGEYVYSVTNAGVPELPNLKSHKITVTIGYKLGGSVSGLATNRTVVLGERKQSLELSVSNNGAFTFPSAITKGSDYEAFIKKQPTGQICTIQNATGTITADVTNIRVSCRLDGNNKYSIGGKASGLANGEQLVVQNNGGDDLTISANGVFTFATKLPNGSHYDVSIKTQPSTQTCTLSRKSGLVALVSVTDIDIQCPTSSISPQQAKPVPGLSTFALFLMTLLISGVAWVRCR